MDTTPVGNRQSSVQQTAPTKSSDSTTFRPLGPSIDTPMPMQKIDESREYSPDEPVIMTNDQSERESHVESPKETEEDRMRREEEESIALARALMAEEAMAVSYHMSVDYLRNNRDQFSEEDLAALQAAMEEEDVEENDDEVEVEDDSGMSYELMLRLGERLGDVKTERWSRIAKEKIQKLPTFCFNPEAVKGMDANDCSVKCLVCQCEYEEEETLRRLPCGHSFHRDCIDQWLMSNDFCPYCRKSIVEGNEE